MGNEKTGMMDIQRFCPIRIEWNNYNHFQIEICTIEIRFRNSMFDGCLFGISGGVKDLVISVFFIDFEIKSPYIK